MEKNFIYYNNLYLNIVYDNNFFSFIHFVSDINGHFRENILQIVDFPWNKCTFHVLILFLKQEL